MKNLADILNESLVNNVGIDEKALDAEFVAKTHTVLKAIKDANSYKNCPQTWLEEIVFDHNYEDEKIEPTALYQEWKGDHPKLYKAAVDANNNDDLNTENILTYIIRFLATYYLTFYFSYADEPSEIRRFKSAKSGVSFGIEEEEDYHAFKFKGPKNLKPFAQVLATYMDTK